MPSPSSQNPEFRIQRAAWLMLLAASCSPAASFSYAVLGNDPGSWPAVLSSIGLVNGTIADAAVVVAAQNSPALASDWTARVEHGTILILEGESPLAAAFGFKPGTKPHAISRSVEDVHAPKLHIIWEKPLEIAAFEMPLEARLFARERWQGIPLMAGFRKGSGAVLWVAAPLGERGYERFPYIPQALADLGLEAPFRSNRLWAFFDSAYRSRVDLDYFAAKWRAAGISALHVAAWHYWERDPQADQYLRHLIEACHRHSIAVYAWLELPHVSEKFWDDHPEWREKTALLQDAQLDWRKLMNLTNRDAFAAVSQGARDLINGFDWDGVNLAELYFESLEGHENPARLTPMNDEVRREFKKEAGFDPAGLFDQRSERYWSKDTGGLKRFLDFRVELARRQQTEWIGEMEAIRKIKPQLDLSLTHVDDRFDTSMKDKIGADTSLLLPLLARHDLTFLIEDPATIWNLGPQRYPEIAARYKDAASAANKLAIDINIVERYQDVYPTKQQTGAELFELVKLASESFERVALYFESSISPVDLPLLSAAASTVGRAEQANGKLVIESQRGTTVRWSGPALVDGRLWPAENGASLLVPRGAHAIEPAPKSPPMRLIDFNGDLKSASALTDGIEFAYQSSARAMAQIEGTPKRLEIDGAEAKPQMIGNVLMLPRGQHLVTITR